MTEQRCTLREAAESLGVSANSLRTWKKAFEQEGNNAFPGNGRKIPAWQPDGTVLAWDLTSETSCSVMGPSTPADFALRVAGHHHDVLSCDVR